MRSGVLRVADKAPLIIGNGSGTDMKKRGERKLATL
jgi:hypothetical protein